MIIWCFCGKRKIRFSHKNSKEYCVLWVNCEIKLLEERTGQRKRVSNDDHAKLITIVLRKFSDRNLSVCLNPKSIPTFTIHHVHPYLSWSDQMPVNSKFYNLNFCRGPNVSTKPVTKFLQNGFRILYCLIRYSFTLGEKWQPLNIEISWVFLNENEMKAIQSEWIWVL